MNGFAINAADINGEVLITLDAMGGSYALDGADAALLYGRFLSADGGSYSTTGSVSGSLRGYVTIADAGSYQVNGADAGFVHGYQMACDPGEYIVDILSADLTKGVFTPALSAFSVPFNNRTFELYQGGRAFSAVLDGERKLRVQTENRTFSVDGR